MFNIIFRKRKTSEHKGLFRSNCSIEETLRPPENRVINKSGDHLPHKKKKNGHRPSRSTETVVQEVNYNKAIFKKCDYTRIRETLLLPLETKYGFIVDDNFVHSLETIYQWCKKPSSLSSVLSEPYKMAGVVLDLKSLKR